jgi:UDP-N-acetylmuramoylalanine--D-glutamate ligase
VVVPITEFRGKHVILFGLARTGIATARALMAGGAIVHAWDDDPKSRERGKAEGIIVEDFDMRDWRAYSALILSPGVPLHFPKPHRVVQLARDCNVPILGDIELFARAVSALPPGGRPRIVGITGTNGKSTTTALLGHILQACNIDARVGGNIGRGVLDLDPMHAGAVYVLELSSYQLDLVETLRCDVAVFLNITPDHLDRHGSMENYVAAKKRIFANQGSGDMAIVGVDDAYSRAVFGWLNETRTEDMVCAISSSTAVGRGVFAAGGKLWAPIDGRMQIAAHLDRAPTLKGRHNAQNAAAAFGAALALGLDPRAIEDALYTFPGLPHRLEPVGRLGRVEFVNDSKATNADAAAQALGVWRDGIHWIAGGAPKEGGIESLAPFFPRIAKAYLIGQAAELFARTLAGKVEYVIAEDLETATGMAAADAIESESGTPVVLLAPACASFDQFTSFEHRGDTFKAIVAELLAGNDDAPLQVRA